MNINFGRVILGGLVTGLILNALEFLLNEVLFKQKIAEILSRLNTPPPGPGFIATAVGATFLLGIVIVLIYAMIRPRFGPGPRTAIIAAFVAWFCVYFYAGILNSALFNMPAQYMLMGMVWGIIEYILGAVAGAWLYKE